jgi:hypothetical protein
VTQTCDPSYSGSLNSKISVQASPGQKLENLFEKVKAKKSGAWLKCRGRDLASVGPEFKHQYHQKKKKKREGIVKLLCLIIASFLAFSIVILFI